MKHFYIAFITFICCPSIFGQNLNNFSRYDEVPVIANHVPRQFPWAGGFNTPQFSPIDLNGDGFDDLFVYERSGNRVYTFINNGNFGQASYTYAPEYEYLFPDDILGFGLLRDFNCDDKPDLFTQYRSDIKVYRNISDDHLPHFILEHDVLPATIFGNQSHVYNFEGDIPVIDDITGNGLIDIVAYSIDGTRAQLFENKTNNCDTMQFHRREGCWGYFREGFFSATIELEDEDCLQWRKAPDSNELKMFESKQYNVSRGTRHVGTSLSAVDLTGNGLKDVLIGDVEIPNLIALYNTGTQDTAVMTAMDEFWPPGTTPVHLHNRASAFEIDVNNDGLNEIIVSPASRNVSKDYDQVWLYTNSGSEQNPEYSLTRNDFLIRHMLNFGTLSYPEFVDVNGNGLLDLIVGSQGYFSEYDDLIEQTARISKLSYYENTGTAQNPEFTFVTDDFADLEQLEIEGLFIEFADMDNDGDLDMIAGTVNGRIIYFENTAPIGAAIELTLSDSALLEMPQATFTMPAVFDLNNDSLPDLIIGNYNGELNYFENKGTAENPQFDQNPDISRLGGIKYRRPNSPGYTAPHFTRFSDDSSAYSLILGTNLNGVKRYALPENPLQNDFELIDSLNLPGSGITPVTADLNNSGIKDLIYGQSAGGLTYMRYNPQQGACCLNGVNCIYTTPGNCDELNGAFFGAGTGCEADAPDCIPVNSVPVLSENPDQAVVYPNPFQDQINIELLRQLNKPYSLNIYNSAGTLIQTHKISNEQTQRLSTADLAPGFYILEIKFREHRILKKIIKQGR